MRRSVLVALLAMAPAAPAFAGEYTIDPGAGSRVEFVSKAPVETFSGKSDRVSGSLALDPAALGDSIQVRIEVDMASLDTGIELRNRHMRENHLHTGKYPKATFQGGRLSKLSSAALAEGAAVTGTLSGEMDLHGTKRPLEAPFEMRLSKGELHVTSRFKVSLADFGIPRPQFLVMRLQDVQQVTVEIVAHPR